MMKPLYNFELIGSRSLRSMNSVFMIKNRVHRNTLIDKLAQSEGCGGRYSRCSTDVAGTPGASYHRQTKTQ